MAVSFHLLSDNGAVEDVEGSKQRRCAMAFVGMRHRASAARFHRQARLGAVERLDLALFVNREDDRMSGRVDVEADNVLEFLCELRIVRQLERPDAIGGELMGPQGCAAPSASSRPPPSLASGRSNGWLLPVAQRAPNRPPAAPCPPAAAACRVCASCRA